ncbi:MAG: Spx/MgsR family RNA polymerase-binding regulatory protein [Nannocystis sp.]|uniref:arsenate reductase family protein n=1 Tax=Nannocystis sp. TaxID=1962667 RepID=UPI002426C629|nr:Spx/MgsR family RNA polymerase-binding regulatory protein [Nannocystis sp.]MBK9755167.1 Spx/MgsR family RNA polymerase-binding regulatory protein [Nannocystis sp.]
MSATFYAYPGCDSCRKARRWLDEHGVAYSERNIATDPPSVATLRELQARAGVPLRRLFNTSGQLYRSGEYARRLATMDDDTARAELAAHGMLIRRPLLLLGELALIGFHADEYAASLAAMRA